MFKNQIVLNSSFSKTEIIEKLKQNCDSWYSDSSKNPFEGKINNHGNFEILPTFDYNSRNQIRPKITGTIDEIEAISTLKLVFELPKNLVFLILFSIIISIIASVISYIIQFEIKWYFFIICNFIFLLITSLIYNSKKEKSIKIIKNILQ